MKNKRLNKLASGVLAVSLVSASLAGCGSIVRDNVAKYPLVPALTEQEVIDYYAESLKYDTLIDRNIEVDKLQYETYPVTGDKAETLKGLVTQAQSLLGEIEYEYSDENEAVLSSDSFDYIKSYLDGKKLTNGQIESITGALGYYFVDVVYEVSARSTGQFNQKTSLLGINGAFIKDPYDVDMIDKMFLRSAQNKLNDYYIANRILKQATFDEETGEFTVEDVDELMVPDDQDASGDGGAYDPYAGGNYGDGEDGDGAEDGDDSTEDADTGEEGTEDDNGAPTGATTYSPDDTAGTDEDDSGTEDGAEDGTDDGGDGAGDADTEEDETGDGAGNEDGTAGGYDGEEGFNGFGGNEQSDPDAVTDISGGVRYTSMVSSERKCQIDTEEFNRVVGSSHKQAAYMPVLSEVFEAPENEGDIGGIGIYPAGENGLRLFGYDRSQMTGELTLRYVFKDTVDGSGSIVGTNVYPVREEITSGFTTTDSNVIIPDFLWSQFSQLLERADRAKIDFLLGALIQGDIYEDMGIAVSTGYEHNSVNLLKQMSTIRQIIARDAQNNAYLLETETTRKEGAKSVDCYGTYRDKYYVVIQQRGDKFVITDELRMSRRLVEEPEIYPDSATEKRLVALNLSGEVSDTEKNSIRELLDDLYNACNYKVLNGPKTITHNGQEVEVEKGMYDCFQDDATMLNTDSKDYMVSELKALLIKHGANVEAVMSGNVTQWIGGYENQVEFTTEELVGYRGMDAGIYMETYYLMSNMNGKWVIDERTELSREEVSGTELSNIRQRLGQ